eukprot:366088-Chlamydomonas_euryale.AAC.16
MQRLVHVGCCRTPAADEHLEFRSLAGGAFTPGMRARAVQTARKPCALVWSHVTFTPGTFQSHRGREGALPPGGCDT